LFVYWIAKVIRFIKNPKAFFTYLHIFIRHCLVIMRNELINMNISFFN